MSLITYKCLLQVVTQARTESAKDRGDGGTTPRWREMYLHLDLGYIRDAAAALPRPSLRYYATSTRRTVGGGRGGSLRGGGRAGLLGGLLLRRLLLRLLGGLGQQGEILVEVLLSESAEHGRGACRRPPPLSILGWIAEAAVR